MPDTGAQVMVAILKVHTVLTALLAVSMPPASTAAVGE